MERAALLLVAAIATALVALCAEFVLDIRAPSSRLAKRSALGASASMSLAEYNKKLAQYRKEYGEERVSVALETSTGRITVELDGKLAEELRAARRFAGMYGMFAVSAGDAAPAIFPFAIDPGDVPTSHEPNITRLRSHFEQLLPAKLLDFKDSDWTRDSCVAAPAWEVGLPKLADWVHVRAQTSCIVHWNGSRPASMLIAVTLLEDDPWVRPFTLWICRKLTGAALDKVIASGGRIPEYAACVLVDRPERTGPTGSQDAFRSDVYEIRDHTPARIY
jgi:hypothetical protein